MQEVIYYNISTGTYILFNVESSNKISFLKRSNKEIGNSFLDAVLPEILEFGGKKEFPPELLEAFDNDSEMDLFLLAPFLPWAKEALIKCLYAVVPLNFSQTYIDAQSRERLHTEAIGARGLIMYKDKAGGGLLAAGVSYEELEMNFFAVSL